MGFYRKVIIQSFRATGAGSSKSVRARPIDGQGLDTSMRVSCSSPMRKNNPVGSLFLLNAMPTDREGGTPYLYARPNAQYRVITEQEAQKFLSEKRQH